MYPALLAVHSIVRWVVLLAAAAALGRAVTGRSSNRPWTSADDAAGRWLTIAIDVQFLIGIILYLFLSPLTTVAFRDFGAAMRTPVLRYWAVEHLAGMIVAAVLVHIGRARVRKATDAASRHGLAALFYGLALLIILASIPWPGLTNGRPLFPGL